MPSNPMRNHWTEAARVGLFIVVLASGYLLIRSNFIGTRAIQGSVWEAIQARAAHEGLDAGFVYSLVAAESSFDPHAAHGRARGLMQLTPEAWESVSKIPYPGAVWDWRTSLDVGISRLADLRRKLVAKGVFSYPLLLEAYQRGPDFVASRKFDLHRMPRPENPIARRLFAGELHPVPPPR